MWKQVPIAATLGFRPVAHEFIDKPLIDALGGEVRCERMPQDVPAAENVPLRILNRQDRMRSGVVRRDRNCDLTFLGAVARLM